MKVYKDNPCNGFYGKCLDVKITNACMGRCAFCIERGGFSPSPCDVEKLIEQTVRLMEYQNVLILGGEPLMYPDLFRYIDGILPYKKNIYLTTNGMLLTPTAAEHLAGKLRCINVSIHSPTQAENDFVYNDGEKGDVHVSFSMLRRSFEVLRDMGTRVRINACMVKGYIDDEEVVHEMLKLGVSLGADEIRFAELQNDDEHFVSANEVFGGDERLAGDPFTDGCERHLVFPDYDIGVIVRMSCGHICGQRPEPENPEFDKDVDAGTKVLYPNGEIFDGWVKGGPKNASSGWCDSHGWHNSCSFSCHPVYDCHQRSESRTSFSCHHYGHCG